MNTNYRNPQADAWYRSVIDNPASFPFSFTYDGNSYTGFAPEHFTLLSRNVTMEGDKEAATLVFALNDSLTVTLECAHWFTHGSTEWKVLFANNGAADSGVLENAGISLQFEGSHPMLKGIWGDHTNWYRPYALDIASAPVHFESNSGRATHVSFPYFNLEYGDGGCMLAIGLTLQIGIQVAINIAVVSNLLPNTGISLPFFSSGGTSLAMLLWEVGVLLSVSRYSATKKV